MTERRSYHRRAAAMMGRLLVLGWTVAGVPAWAQMLPDLLAAVAAEARAPQPLRADVQVERDGTAKGDVVLLARGRRIYLETRSGTRALLSPGKVVVLRGGHVVRAPRNAALEGTDVLLQDLVPFDTGSLPVPQVSDETPARVVVTGAPRPPSAYALLVHTIDRDRDVIVQTKYYQDSISNLAKIRRDEDFAQVGGRWRPGAVSMQTFREMTTTRLTMRWREATDAPPALFTPAGLRAPSPITWP